VNDVPPRNVPGIPVNVYVMVSAFAAGASSTELKISAAATSPILPNIVFMRSPKKIDVQLKIVHARFQA
jgi:hypothetical protein